MKRISTCLFFTLFALSFYLASAESSIQSTESLHRVIILTDIEADPDDTQSLVRLMLYTNEIEIRGLVATTSCWQKTRIAPESIKNVIDAYAQVLPNLQIHADGYPDAEQLHALVKKGLPVYGMLGVGEGKNSEGSDWILRELQKEDDRPLWISVWGGVNTLAQTLYEMQKTLSAEQVEALVSKLRVYTISDQDDSGVWIRKHFPKLFYIVSPGDDYGSATWIAINSFVEGIDNTSISNSWIAENIQQRHGPLGACYPDVAWGMEGDTPAFLSLIPNGLNAPEHPDWGAWGGRYELNIPEFTGAKGHSGVPIQEETRPIWTDTSDTWTPFVKQEFGRNYKQQETPFSGQKVTLWRWRDDIQNDFAARVDWCTKSFSETNHPPIPKLKQPLRFTVKSGSSFELDAGPTTDPDGDSLTYLWFPYPEAGTYQGEFSINQPENVYHASATAPVVEKPETIHIILKVTDKGTPALTRYQRVIVTVEP